MNNLYPIFLKIEREPVLVVGGGKVAEQKIKGLLEANADVTVIAPVVSANIEKLAEERKIVLHRRRYESGDVEGVFIVICATNDRDVQEIVFKEARDRKIPVNIADMPDRCTFYLSSVFQKGDLKVAVSTNGKSPTLGKIIRDKIAAEYSDGYPALLGTIGGLRPEIQKTLPDFESRKKLYEHIVQTELKRPHSYSKNYSVEARDDSRSSKNSLSVGKVYLVGAGPGDPELITVKALRLLRSAEVVLYDALISNELLSEVPESAEKIYVGKRAGAHCVKQEEINELLIRKVCEGKCVVRLKGGDPFVFGRGGEEVKALQEAGIEVEAVPGVTAGVGLPTSLGIPLTHREESSSVLFLTGHEAPAKSGEHVDWECVSHVDTIVIYMGVKRLGIITERLIRHGVSASKPVAVIFGGTLPAETVVTGTMENIEERAGEFSTDLPGLIVVGNVVRFFREFTTRESIPAIQEPVSPEVTILERDFFVE